MFGSLTSPEELTLAGLDKNLFSACSYFVHLHFMECRETTKNTHFLFLFKKKKSVQLMIVHLTIIGGDLSCKIVGEGQNKSVSRSLKKPYCKLT